MTADENEIVVYQPNETVRLDVRLENETVWLAHVGQWREYGKGKRASGANGEKGGL